MIRSELIQKIADDNPHLYQRDVERIVNTIFEEITGAMDSQHDLAAVRRRDEDLHRAADNDAVSYTHLTLPTKA